MTINLDDLREDTSTVTKDFHLNLKCGPDLGTLITDFRTRYGRKKAAEVIRRLISAGLPVADEQLKIPKKK